MDQKLIDRINALAKKSREEGLTDQEKEEQLALRQEYIAGFKKSMHAALENVYVLDEEGNEVPISQRRKPDDTPDDTPVS